MESPFATPASAISDAWNFVLASTTIPEDLREALLPAYVYAHRSGNPKLEAPALAILGAYRWEWPSFEEWLERFRETGEWPYIWNQNDIPALVKRDSQWKLRQARVEVLAHTLAMTAYNARDCTGKSALMLRHGWSLVDIRDPVEMRIAQQIKRRIDVSDWRTWPPFFPGDRTSLHANLPRHSQKPFP
jgi:hypothetical protein